MAYNYGYPNGLYQPYGGNFTGYGGYATQPMQQQPQQQQAAQNVNNGLLWVQGEAGAKAFIVAPGNTVLLMDSENTVMYLKSCDASGMPSLRIFDYTERNAAPKQPAPNADFITRQEFEERLKALIKSDGGATNE